MAHQMAYGENQKVEIGNSGEDAVKTNRTLAIVLLCGELAVYALAWSVANLVLLLPMARKTHLKPAKNPLEPTDNRLIKSQ